MSLDRAIHEVFHGGTAADGLTLHAYDLSAGQPHFLVIEASYGIRQPALLLTAEGEHDAHGGLDRRGRGRARWLRRDRGGFRGLASLAPRERTKHGQQKSARSPPSTISHRGAF